MRGQVDGRADDGGHVGRLDGLEVVVQRRRRGVVGPEGTVVETGLDPAGQQHGDADRRAEQVVAQALREGMQRGLGRAVDGGVRRRVLAGDRAEEEQVSPVARQHPGQDEPGHLEGGAQVHVHQQVDRVAPVLGERSQLGQDPGVVDDDVEGDVADRRLERGRVADVQPVRDRAGLRGDASEVVIVEGQRVHDVSAVAEGAHDPFADPAGRPGDEGDVVAGVWCRSHDHPAAADHDVLARDADVAGWLR